MKFIIGCTILVSDTSLWNNLILKNDLYDYFSIMLYNGGMY